MFGAVVAGLLLADERLTPRKIVGALLGFALIALGLAVTDGRALQRFRAGTS